MIDDPSDEARALWRDQPSETPPMTLAHIHARAYQSRVRWRNAREYLAGAVGIAGCAWLATRVEAPLIQLGLVMMIIGALVAMWQLYRRGSSRVVQPAAAAQSLAFHRTQLVRQRDALRSVWWWYLAPNVPGIAVTLLGQALARPERSVAVGILTMATVAMFVGIGLLNRWGAGRLQAQIDELDALEVDQP